MAQATVNPEWVIKDIISASGSTGGFAAKLKGDQLIITDVEQSALDAAIAAYDDTTSQLDQARQYKYKIIDREVREAISQGFVFEGATFSLSDNAQRKLDSLHGAYQAGWLPLPRPISTKDNGTYELTADKALAFFQMALGAVDVHIQASYPRKAAVKAATTLAEVEAA